MGAGARPAALLALTAAASAGCAMDFEEPSIVLDTRVLAIALDPPERLVDLSGIDPQNPGDFDPSALEGLTTTACALVADPEADRTLFFEYVLCPETESRRCDDPDDPVFRFASGTIDDPDTAADEQLACGTLEPSPALVPVFERAIEEDPFSGFGGLPVQVELRLRPDGVTDADAEVASKRMLYTPQILEEQTQNENPSVAFFTAVAGQPGSDDRPEADEDAAPLDLRACSELGGETPAVTVGPDTRVTFLPVEADGARQDYLVPTFDGDIRELTENLSYQWVSTGGDWVDEETGGPVDPFGNDPPLRATWESPPAEDLEGPETIQFWSVVRDERGGQDWYRWCVRVEP